MFGGTTFQTGNLCLFFGLFSSVVWEKGRRAPLSRLNAALPGPKCANYRRSHAYAETAFRRCSPTHGRR